MTTPPPLDDYQALLAWLEEYPERASALVLYLAEEQEFEGSKGSRPAIPPSLQVLVDPFVSVRRAHGAQFGHEGIDAEEMRLSAMVEDWKRAWGTGPRKEHPD